MGLWDKIMGRPAMADRFPVSYAVSAYFISRSEAHAKLGLPVARRPSHLARIGAPTVRAHPGEFESGFPERPERANLKSAGVIRRGSDGQAVFTRFAGAGD
jgi:hypothetical protein